MSDGPTAHLTAGDTVFVRSTSGVILQMDVPATSHARERFDQSVAKGDLALVDEAHAVTRPDGSIWFVAGPDPSDAPKEPKSRRTSKPAAAPAAAKTETPAAPKSRRGAKATATPTGPGEGGTTGDGD